VGESGARPVEHTVAVPHDSAHDEALPDIDPDRFFGADLRVGRVLEVRPFPEARKPAYRLTVDFGPAIGTLETSAQVTNYEPEELVGRLVVGAVNLGTRRIAGFESQFLVLGAVEADGGVRLLRPDGDPPPGTHIA
jgi:tRNA-binding protein